MQRVVCYSAVMEESLRPLASAFAAYLTQRWQVPCEVVDLQQIPGGASRETYRVTLHTNNTAPSSGHNNPLPQAVILRRDPDSSLIDTERAHEYAVYEAVYRSGLVPVPQPLVLEERPGTEMARPFSVMQMIEGGQATPAGLEDPAMQGNLASLAEQKWSLLGRLAATPASDLALTFLQVPEHPAKHELNYWTQVINTDSLHPQPVAQAAIRWLERHLPEPQPHRCLVHGDYRTGNFLYDAKGKLLTVLDWEMAHIGDPLEDLAWSLDPLWSGQPHLAGRLCSRRKAVEIWEQASGMLVDTERFRWWQVFASLKALAIWISSNEDFLHGNTKEPILAMAGWPMINLQNRILADRLSPISKHEVAEALL